MLKRSRHLMYYQGNGQQEAVPEPRLDGRIYLRVGDEVDHRRYPQWGRGVVVEERASSLRGGLCLARVMFTDGQERSFINNLDDQNCCYYAGLRITSA
jgi:hypothetical protein